MPKSKLLLTINDTIQVMADFNRGNRSQNNRSFGKPSFNRDAQSMHAATCDSCGKSCEVPFRPTGNKPVYCRDCFKKTQGSDDSRRSDNQRFNRSSEERQMYDAVCAKCGTSCKVPFRPSSGREIFCSRCFETKQGAESGRFERRTYDKPRFTPEDRRPTENYAAQFATLHAKMDKILSLLTPNSTDVAPLESAINETVITEIAEEIQGNASEVAEKKPKKTKAATKKKTATKAAPTKK